MKPWRVMLAAGSLLLAVQGRADEARVEALRALARPLDGAMDALVARLGQARLALLGEASHGTAEFYTRRDEISRRLIAEHGFRFLALEGDWNAIYRLHQYVQGEGAEGAARDIMRGFTRWPTWMWANEETAALVEWLREHNATQPPGQRVGLYGMDVYGQDDALRELPDAIAVIDLDLSGWIREQYACFAPFMGNPGLYLRATQSGRHAGCDGAARAVVEALRERAVHATSPHFFHCKQMALVVKSAEKHYRTMNRDGAESWNHRADHFKLTVRRLLDREGPEGRGIVWAHNTHIGDARATEMHLHGQRNIGQLARERWGEAQVASVGFGTHRGRVIAGRRWGGPREVMALPPARAGSLEALLHATGSGDCLLFLDDAPPLLAEPIGHRAVGVIYHPEGDAGNYVPTRLARRYNAFLFIEETHALTPLD